MGETEVRGKRDAAAGRQTPENLRKHLRFRVEDTKTEMYLKGFLSKIGLNRKNEARVAVNLSEGGVLVLTNNKLKVGTRVHLRIELESHKDVIEAEGEVRWCYASAKDATDYYAGIEFVNLAPANLSRIQGMRAWFTSPEFKAKSATRRRLAGPELIK